MTHNIEVNGYSIHPTISESRRGTYGAVVDCYRISDSKPFVMKFFGYTKNKPDISYILREIDNLKALDNINGVAHIETIFNDSIEGYISKSLPKLYRKVYPIIVMEKLAGGELFERILLKDSNNESFTERDAAIIFKTFITALDDIHTTKNMINIDLKSENLVFGNSEKFNSVKIIDFGMAVTLHNRTEHYEDRLGGTEAYLAPESIISFETIGQAKFSRASDVWQAGCILFTLLTVSFPFGSNKTTDLRSRIKQRKFIFHDLSQIQTRFKLSNNVIDLFDKLFTLDPTHRITCKKILHHPWIQELLLIDGDDIDDGLSLQPFGSDYFHRLRSFQCQRKFRQLLNQSTILNIQTKLQEELATTAFINEENSINNNSCDTTGGGYGGGYSLKEGYDTNNNGGNINNNGSSSPRPSLLAYSLIEQTTATPNTSSGGSSDKINKKIPISTAATVEAEEEALNTMIANNSNNNNDSSPRKRSKSAAPILQVNSTSSASASSSTTTPKTTLNISQPVLFKPQVQQPSMMTSHSSKNSMTNFSNSSSSPRRSNIKKIVKKYFVITYEGIQVLKEKFLLYQNSDGADETAANNSGLDWEAFREVVLSANFANLATERVFNIFDWNHSGSVDYLEFLLALSSFRRDVDWDDIESVARLYYDIFDVNGDNSISVECLALVLSKLEQDFATMFHINNNSNSDTNNNTNNTAMDELNEEFTVFNPFDQYPEEINALVQFIDTDGDGSISYDEFMRFLTALNSLKSNTTNSSGSIGSNGNSNSKTTTNSSIVNNTSDNSSMNTSV